MSLCDEIAKTIWVAMFELAFDKTPTMPWDDQAEAVKDKHRKIAQRLIDAGLTTGGSKYFIPTEKTREIMRTLGKGLTGESMDKFFEIWEEEIANPRAPRIAGSVICHAHLNVAARFAVFGAQCCEDTPNEGVWLENCKEAFADAVKDCTLAKAAALVRVDVASQGGDDGTVET